MTTLEINNGLKIEKLSGQKFRARFGGGYYVPVGHCLHHEKLGYLGFKDSPFTPYIPCGGKQALERILKDGGMVSFDQIQWIRPIEV